MRRVRRPRFPGPAMALVLLLAAACGQSAGAHAQIGDAAAKFWGEAPGTAASPNGENTNPGADSITYQYTVTSTRKAIVTPRGKRVDNPLQFCPVRGRGSFSDDFGAPRYAGGFHHHAGNDMFAVVGTPIVAPFDGRAVATPNSLGGLAVTVYGAQGYVYNAHLVAYGRLGRVERGQVIGFVGSTGDARGGAPHDHFEWHPYGEPLLDWRSPYGLDRVGNAVDPFPYLQKACT